MNGQSPATNNNGDRTLEQFFSASDILYPAAKKNQFLMFA